MKGYFIDQQTDLVQECYAVVYAPRKQRTRFPENVVTVVETAVVAMDRADNAQKQYAAKVIGPARSSEGFNMFYLVEWL